MRLALLVLAACSMSRPTHDEALARIHAIDTTTRVADLETTWGAPTADVGSGIHIFVYPLADGGELRVGSPDGKAIMYVVLKDASGQQKFDVR